MRWIAATALALTLVGSGVLAMQPPKQAVTQASLTGKIVFVSHRDGVDHLYVMDATGLNTSRLGNNAWKEGSPEWSPDGTKVAFEGYVNGVGIYTMNSDGSGLRRLSPSPGKDVRPAWSPDGSKIVFSRVIGTPVDGQIPPTQIMVMNADGSNPQTIMPAGGTFNIEPKWSPDGTKIVFMSGRNQGQDLYTMTPTGGGLTRITNVGANGDPAWSPDSKSISFGSNREGSGRLNIFIADASSANVRQVTHYAPPYEAGDTSWSPDGLRLVYEYDVDGKGQSDPNARAEVRIINIDGTGEMPTAQACSGVGCSPRWR